MKELFDLTDKVAIVTGASRGLGKSMAIGLAQAGANIVVTDVLDVNDTVKEIEKLGRECIGIKVDVTQKKDVDAMVQQTVDKFGKIDILVNNAGILRMSPAEEMKEEDWDKVIAVNLKGEFLCAQAVGKQMIKQKSGRIINIASVAGQFGFPQAAAYDCSKGGVILLTKALAAEWAKYNIRVNAIAPGVFATAMTEDMLKSKEFMEMVKKNVPMGRVGQPEELVGVVVFLASEASSYVTGHVLVVDGGWTAGL
ncbi:MAG: glucose 1-dehydrogenase [Candidatus Aenigmarchaeota archaeon]|nr:glucose 1-dehydrogenase [Candidatus Aenigmarchaeota archaeon]